MTVEVVPPQAAEPDPRPTAETEGACSLIRPR